MPRRPGWRSALSLDQERDEVPAEAGLDAGDALAVRVALGAVAVDQVLDQDLGRAVLGRVHVRVQQQPSQLAASGSRGRRGRSRCRRGAGPPPRTGAPTPAGMPVQAVMSGRTWRRCPCWPRGAAPGRGSCRAPHGGQPGDRGGELADLVGLLGELPVLGVQLLAQGGDQGVGVGQPAGELADLGGERGDRVAGAQRPRRTRRRCRRRAGPPGAGGSRRRKSATQTRIRPASPSRVARPLAFTIRRTVSSLLRIRAAMSARGIQSCSPGCCVLIGVLQGRRPGRPRVPGLVPGRATGAVTRPQPCRTARLPPGCPGRWGARERGGEAGAGVAACVCLGSCPAAAGAAAPVRGGARGPRRRRRPPR